MAILTMFSVQFAATNSETILSLPEMYSILLQHPFQNFQNLFTMVFLTIFTIVALIVLLLIGSLTAALFAMLCQATSSWAFGWTSFANGLLVELAIEPLPFGEHKLVQIDWASESWDRFGITHSWTHSHPLAIQHLRDWIVLTLVRRDGCSEEALATG